MTFVKYKVGDIVRMKKKHPCGADIMEVKRIGTDFMVICTGCGHQVLMARPKFEKAAKSIVSRLTEEGEDDDKTNRLCD